MCLSALVLHGCSHEATPEEARREVVLYSSADDYLLREVVEDFEAQTGIDVLDQGDTEATKTTGLMQRLISERESPKADVWWSSESAATVRLSREGVLEGYTSQDAEGAFDGGWPAGLRGEHEDWYGFALRARVIAFRPGAIDGEPPRTLRELTDPKWKGRVGIARPEFGTTRGHMAALVAAFGEQAFESWLAAMKRNDVRVYNSNSAVVRAIADGEIDLGLTDTDDVFSAQRNDWAVELAFERADAPGAEVTGLPSLGAMVIPNTVAKVRGGPNSEEADALVDYLLSERAARLIAKSDSHNLPVLPALASEFAEFGPPPGDAWAPPAEDVADAVEAALTVVARVLQ